MREKKISRNEIRKELIQGVTTGVIPMNEALRLVRKIVDKNQTDYAKLVGVSKKIVADFEVNKGNPTLATVNKLFSPVGLVVGLSIKKLG